MPAEAVLEELDAHRRVAPFRRWRYVAISDALAAGHTQRAVAAACMSPAVLSRMIRQDTARRCAGS